MTATKSGAKDFMRQRPFAYASLYEHPPLPFAAFGGKGFIRSDIPKEIATCCKNESNCTVFFNDGTWLTTWSQGAFEHATDERIVFSTSTDLGQTWTSPKPIIFSSTEERIAYGTPFIVPASQRLYLFFHAGAQLKMGDPAYDSGHFNFIFSDDRGATWSERRIIPLPDRDINIFADRLHGWLNHPPEIMPGDNVVLPFTAYRVDGGKRRAWLASPAEVGVIQMDNILTESDPEKLKFGLHPSGPRGIRVDLIKHLDNASLKQLASAFGVLPEEISFNFQEMTVRALADGRWIGVGRTFLGSPGFTISQDQGLSWSAVEPLRYAPDGPVIKHPMTMCPIAQTSDDRIILLFTNNDGSGRGAKHVWDGDGKTRNPQWFAVARQIPGESRNGGLVFGEPRILADVDDSEDTNLKTGVSMPQFFEREGRFFIAYNINKEHLLLDEIPSDVLQEMTPA